MLSHFFPFVEVCSTNDSAKLMLQCINEGAADYILKPLRKDVLKTMFLVSRGLLELFYFIFCCQSLTHRLTESSSISSGWLRYSCCQ
jgi:DNA-binding NarL/FixJ family response regulator